MIATRLKLTNWKNFKTIDIALCERVFIVGQNAAGKSNLLDVFRFLRDIAKSRGGGLQQAVSVRGHMARIRSLAARNPPHVEIEVHLGEPGDAEPRYRYSIGIQQENRGKRRLLLTHERVWVDNRQVLNRPDSADRADRERLTRTYLETPTNNGEFRDVAEFFAGISYVHLVPQLLRSVKSIDVEGAGEDLYGRNFLVRVSQTPEKIRKARLKKIHEALAKAVPQFDALKDEKDAAGVPHLMMRLKHWRLDAGWQNEEQFSDGTIRMLGLFWAMLEGDSMILFEEPELSLNERIVEQLAGLLYKLQTSRGRQTILTTHSYSLLSDPGVTPEEVVLLTPVNEGTEATVTAEIPEIAALVEGGLSVGQAVLPHAAPPSLGELIA